MKPSQIFNIILFIFNLHLCSSGRVKLILLIIAYKFDIKAKLLIIFPNVDYSVFL